MNTQAIITTIDQEIARLQQARDMLSSLEATPPIKRGPGRPKGSSKARIPVIKTKRTVSPEGRARIAEAQRRRHAKRKRAANKAARDLVAA